MFCGDSYFESVGSSDTLKTNGMWLIGLVKTETKKWI